jgi:hypothetical protein
MKSDKITSIVGAVGAAATAAQPVLHGVEGSLHSGDYFQLVSAVLFAVLGFFTNKQD